MKRFLVLSLATVSMSCAATAPATPATAAPASMPAPAAMASMPAAAGAHHDKGHHDKGAAHHGKGHHAGKRGKGHHAMTPEDMSKKCSDDMAAAQKDVDAMAAGADKAMATLALAHAKLENDAIMSADMKGHERRHMRACERHIGQAKHHHGKAHHGGGHHHK